MTDGGESVRFSISALRKDPKESTRESRLCSLAFDQLSIPMFLFLLISVNESSPFEKSLEKEWLSVPAMNLRLDLWHPTGHVPGTNSAWPVNHKFNHSAMHL
jgi:hypothetical protein